MNKKTDREKNENIQVFVRCRPLSALERKQNSYSVVDAIPEQKEIIVREKITEKFFSRTFAFDKVFGPKASQLEVHKMVVGPLIKEVLMGYNCTVFAYGQTGTGKTFTMEGERSNEIYKWEEDPLAGIIPRTLQQIFEELKSLNIEFTVRVSFLELYNEEIFDLLGPSEDSSKLRLFDDTSRKGSVVIQGLEEITLRSKNDIYYILEKGSAKRHKAATLLNASSSRSHTVFSVTVHIKENSLDGEDLLKIGKLNLVDLAGSENIGRSGAVDRTAREAGNINQSLLTLGRVITALVERAPHIPYRESKLTRLLQDSLGGRTKTSIIATVSPAHSNIEETLNTLDYAHRAKNITNKPEVNQKLSKQALLKEYTEEIRKLHKDLEAARRKNGIFVDEENYNQMQLELSTKSDEIRQTVAEIEVLKEQIEKVNELFCSTKVDLDKITKELEHQKLETSEKAQELQERTKELTHTRKALDTISLQHDEQQHLVYHHVKNEKKLSAQGQKLKATADRTTTDLKALHEKLERKRTIEKLNDEQSYKFRVNLQQHMGEMEDSITQMWQQQSEYVNNMQSILGSGVELFHRQMTALSNVMSTLISSHSGLLGTLSSQLNHQGKVEQQWAGDTIKTVAQKKEMATSNHRTFLSEQFIPLMNVMQMLIQSQAATVQDHGKLLHSKLEQQESSIKFHLEEQKDALLQLKKNIQLFSSEQRNGLEACQQHVARGIQFESELNKEWEEQINIIQKAISSVKQIMEKHHSQVTQEVPVIQKQLEDVSRSSQENKIKIDSNAKTLSSMLENFETSFIADTKDLAASSVENLSKVKETIHDIKEKHETLKSDILEFGHHSELTWEQNYQTMESIVRLHAETEIQDLQDNQYCIQELATAMRAAAEQHDSLLELHKLEFEAQAAAQKSVISNMKDSNSIWSQEFSARIWQRDKEMENYLYEEMLKDQPTGQTPERKEYVYSKDLVKTTPDDKVLQRLRAIIYPSEKLVYSIPDSSFSEGDISSDFDDDTHQVKPEFTNEFSSGELSLTEVHDDTENKEDKENIVYTSVVAKHLSPPTPKTTSSPSPIKPLRANNIV